MTAIDGARQPGSIHNVPGHVLDRLDDIARITGRSHAELVTLAVVDANFAPPVETRSVAAPPGDRAGHRGSPPAPVVVDARSYLDEQAERCVRNDDRFMARKAAGHIPEHVHLNDAPCVYGDRCGQ